MEIKYVKLKLGQKIFVDIKGEKIKARASLKSHHVTQWNILRHAVISCDFIIQIWFGRISIFNERKP